MPRDLPAERRIADCTYRFEDLPLMTGVYANGEAQIVIDRMGGWEVDSLKLIDFDGKQTDLFDSERFTAAERGWFRIIRRALAAHRTSEILEACIAAGEA